MENILAVFTTCLMLCFAFYYSFNVFKKKSKPALSTWIIMSTGTSLSFITYFLYSKLNLLGGILNFADAISTVMIVIAVILWSKSKVIFLSFEKYYLLFASLIVVFWILSKNAFISNLLIQAIIFTAYIPTIHKIIKNKKSSESLSSWLIAFFASFIALYPTIKSGNILSLIYIVRSITMQSIIIGLTYFYNVKLSHE